MRTPPDPHDSHTVTGVARMAMPNSREFLMLGKIVRQWDSEGTGAVDRLSTDAEYQEYMASAIPPVGPILTVVPPGVPDDEAVVGSPLEAA